MTDSSTEPAEPGCGRLDSDIAIVGGGPVGATTGLLLAKRGFRVSLFEQRIDVYDLPRAVGMDAEIQRVFQNAGLYDEIQRLTTPIAGAEFVNAAGERIIGHEVPVDKIYPLGHHPNVMFHQPWLEAMIRTAASEAGVDLQLGTEVVAVTQDAAGVTLTTAGGEHRARWLIGADGAASPIRKSLGIDFEDQGFDQDWLVFDVELTSPGEHLPPFAQQVCDPKRPVTFVPGHGDFRRWEYQLQPGEDAAEMTKPERVWELLTGWLTPDQATLSRAVVYRFHATVATTMRSGRVFLAGDSAHQMPPFLGQGMCSGVRDAANLAWKLELVHRGMAGDRLLDSYDAERRPHAIDMVSHAVDTGKLIDQLAGRTDSEVGLDAGYGGGRGLPYLRHGVLAGDHPKTGKQLPQPVVDGRFFDESLGDGWNIITRRETLQPGPAVERWEGIGARVVSVPPELFADELLQDGAILVRPDRYVAAVVGDVERFSDVTDELMAAMGVDE